MQPDVAAVPPVVAGPVVEESPVAVVPGLAPEKASAAVDCHLEVP